MDGKVTKGNFLKGKTAKRILAIGFLALTCIAVLGGTAFAAFSRGSVMPQPAAIGTHAALGGAEELQVSEMLASSHPFSIINLRTSGSYALPGQRFSLPIGRGLTLPNGSVASDGDAPVMLLLDTGAALLGSAEGAEGADALTEAKTEKAEAVIEALAEEFAEEELAEAVDEAESELSIMALGAEPAESGSFSITQSKQESYMNNVPGTVNVYVSGETDPVAAHNTLGTEGYTSEIADGTTMSMTVTAPKNYAIASVSLNGGELTPAAEYDITHTTRSYSFSFAAGQSINVVLTQQPDRCYFTLAQTFEGNEPPANIGQTKLNKRTGGTPIYSDKSRASHGDVSISGGEAALTGSFNDYIALGHVEAGARSGCCVKAINTYVNGTLSNTMMDYSGSDLNENGNRTIYFNSIDSSVLPLGSHLKIEVVYTKNLYTLTQSYVGTGSPTNYGTTTLNKNSSSGTPIYNASWNGKVSITSAAPTLTGSYARSDLAFGNVSAVPASGYCVNDIKVFIDDSTEPDRSALDYEGSPNMGGTWTINFSNSFAPAVSSHVRIEVEYSRNSYTLTQSYIGNGTSTDYGSTTLNKAVNSGTPFTVDGLSGNHGNVSVTGTDNTKSGGYTSKSTALGNITAAPADGYSVGEIEVYVDGTLTPDALDYDNPIYSGDSNATLKYNFSSGFEPAIGSHVEIIVSYTKTSFILTQRYEGHGNPTVYGSTTIHKSSGEHRPFFWDKDNDTHGDAQVTSADDTLTGRYSSNSAAWGDIYAVPITGYSVSSINVYYDAAGGDDFVLCADALDLAHPEYSGEGNTALKLDFNDFDPPIGSNVKIEVVYSRNLYTLEQSYIGKDALPTGTSIGTTTVFKAEGGRPFYSDADNDTHGDASVTGGNVTQTGRYASNESAWGYVAAAPAVDYTAAEIKVYVDESGGNDFVLWPDALDYDNPEYIGFGETTLKLNFKSFAPAAGSHVKIVAVYTNNPFTLTHRFEGKNALPEGANFGTTTLNKVPKSGRPFYCIETGNTHGDIKITGEGDIKTGRYTFNADAWGNITAAPTAGYSATDIKVYVDGILDENALDYSNPLYSGDGNTTLTLNFKDFDPALNSHVRIEAVYTKNPFTLTQKFEGIGSPSDYAVSKLEKTDKPGRPFYCIETNDSHGEITVSGGNGTKTGRYTKNEDSWGKIIAAPAAGYSVADVIVKVDDVECDNSVIFEEAVYGGIGLEPSAVTLKFKDFDPAAGSQVDIEVVYTNNPFTLAQSFVGEGSPADFGTTGLYKAGGHRPFYSAATDDTHGDISISGGSVETTGRYTLNKYAWGRIEATPKNGCCVKDIKVFVDETGGNNFGEPLEGALVYSEGSRSATGKWTATFAPDFAPPVGSHVMIVAEYTDWGAYSLSQKYDAAVSPAPSTLGTVSLTGSKSFIVDGVGSAITNPQLSSSEASESGTLQPADLSGDGVAITKLQTLDITPPTGCSVKDVVIKVGGAAVTDALDEAASKQPVGGKWELVFADGYAIEVGSSLDIEVTYTTLYNVTLTQENLVLGGLGTVSLAADGAGFAADGSTSGSFNLTASSDNRQILPETTLSALTVTPPEGLTVISASSNLLVDGKDAVTLNEDGTVSFAAVIPEKDVTIEIKYGSRMFIKSSIADVVTVDSAAASTSFAKLCDLDASEKTVSITALDGWVIKSVKYGTDSGSQSTPLTATGDSYEITSIASDIYLDVEVERDSRKLSAKLDGEGGASIVYGGVTTALTDAATVIDSAVQIDSTVSFEAVADANSEITDVTLNGVSLGSTRSFTMPESDSVIVVYTELKEFDINAVLTGDGEAAAVYGGTTTTLGTTAKVVAADVVTGTYDVVINPLEGSEIVSVSVDGTPLTPKSENVYSVAVAADDVLVTVNTRKLPEYSINAKASIAGAAKANEIDLTTDYAEILTALEGESAALTFTIDPQYKLVEVKCGDTPDALAAITLTDSAYSFDALDSDKYVEVVLEALTKPTITVNRTGDGVVYTNGGSADVSNTSYTVESGSDHRFDFIPLDGAQLVKVTVKIGESEPVTAYDSATGVNVPMLRKALNTAGKSSHTIENITENVTINAEFTTLPEYKLHLIKEGEGEGTFEFDGTSYTASFDADVTHGSTPSITIKAKNGSKLESVKVGDSAESAVKAELTDSVLTLPEISGDVYVVVSLKKVEPSSGIPTTGDDGTGVILTAVAANLFILSGLACTAIMQKMRRKQNEQA